MRHEAYDINKVFQLLREPRYVHLLSKDLATSPAGSDDVAESLSHYLCGICNI